MTCERHCPYCFWPLDCGELVCPNCDEPVKDNIEEETG